MKNITITLLALAAACLARAETIVSTTGAISSSLNTSSYFGLQFTTPAEGDAYVLTGFRFLGPDGEGAFDNTPAGAGTAYLFSSSPHNAVSPSGVSGYTTGLVAVSGVWDGSQYAFANVPLDVGSTYYVVSDTNGFSVGHSFAIPNNALYATGPGNNYVNQLQTLSFEAIGTAIPEPASAAVLLGIGGLAAAVSRRRRVRG